jgi:hypothetical protein
MPERIPLPEHLRNRPFSRKDLELARLSQGRLNRSDVTRPYHGVQTTTPPSTLRERCSAYAVRMRPGQAFSHSTAALLHDLPLPARLEATEETLHVCCVRPAMPPRTVGVVGHRLTAAPVVQDLDGLQVCVPSEAWCQLAADLSLDELIAMADHLLTVSPLTEEATRRLLLRRIAASRRVGADRLEAALTEARRPVRSPGETRLRLLLVRAGIEEPEVNGKVEGRVGRLLGHADLVWGSERLVAEYEGDGHRVDKEQFRRDIERYERFRDAGWEVVRVTADDLVGSRAARLVERIRTRLARRA